MPLMLMLVVKPNQGGASLTVHQLYVARPQRQTTVMAKLLYVEVGKKHDSTKYQLKPDIHTCSDINHTTSQHRAEGV
ncbi:hypothetical protein EVAR_79713_1 [Eumeta japonica]|uniref:Uncharacterized protein n=1 Tax=Eumeta variegata TaxID=151549 RepID=A0A4C1TA42_EUMVA|nr:hypothetical protein EVAR_79713_1 [Eumeta japonica]